jgi:hypothetical protein
MKKYFITLGILQAVTALGAIPAGIGYLADTSGRAMGVTTAMLADSPLDTFLLPGLFLLIINGIITAAASYLSFTRHTLAGYAGLVLGIILCLWILIQVAWITLSSFLQPMFFIVGLADILLSSLIIRKQKIARTES